MNEWADARAMNDLYGPRTSGMDWMGWQAEFAALRRAAVQDPGSVPAPIATAAFAFPDFEAYGIATYGSTMRALRTLEQTVGPSKLNDAMKTYARTFAFKHPTGRDLFDVLTKELGQDLSWFFGPVWHQVGGMKLAIRTASCRKAHPPRGIFGDGASKKSVGESEAPDTGSYVCSLVVENTGTIHVPVDIDLKFADGSSHTLQWDDRGAGNWKSFEFDRSSPLTEVRLDPKGKIWVDSPIEHTYRVDGDGSASLRAAAWFASTTQTLMQIVGL